MDLTIQIIIYVLIVASFAFDVWLSRLNYKNRNAEIPVEVQGIYDEEKYQKWLSYYMENHRFNLIAKVVGNVIFIALLALGGFRLFDTWAQVISNDITQVFLFMAMYILLNNIIDLPFDYYRTFTIEEKYGFNKTTKKTFYLDKIKSLLLLALIGGGVLIGVYNAFVHFGSLFIVITWIIATVFVLGMNLLYVPVFVPIFNKLTPLEDGELKDMINEFAHKVGYEVSKISVMDASRRSTKLNAFFAGFGKTKQIVLYDTLVDKMSNEEIVAVLAHEVGHNKHKHIVFNMIQTSLLLLLYFGLFYILLINDSFPQAFGITNETFAFSIILFTVLISPLSILIGMLTSGFSMKHEYQADRYANVNYSGEAIINALKVLSRENFSHLTPHPLVVKLTYSHPPVKDRIKAVRKDMENA